MTNIDAVTEEACVEFGVEAYDAVSACLETLIDKAIAQKIPSNEGGSRAMISAAIMAVVQVHVSGTNLNKANAAMADIWLHTLLDSAIRSCRANINPTTH